MKNRGFGFWFFTKLVFFIVLIGSIVYGFKHPTKSKLYAKQVYNYFIGNDSTIIVPLETDNSGMYYIKAKLNDTPIRFIIDTGCSTMLISIREADFLLHHKIVSEKSIIGDVQSICANGEIEVNKNINIDKVEVNGIELKNIPCMVSNSKDTPLLLGQAVLSKLGKITIDYNNNLLIINR